MTACCLLPYLPNHLVAPTSHQHYFDRPHLTRKERKRSHTGAHSFTNCARATMKCCHYSSILFAMLLLLSSLLCTTSSSESLPSKEEYRVIGLEHVESAFGAFHGTMYAGRIPTNNQDGKLMFWLYESPNNTKLTIWLNGGPGCSSFGGMMVENGPVTAPHFESGKLHTPTSPPLETNEYSWTRATSMLYVEQPAGTGFSSVSQYSCCCCTI